MEHKIISTDPLHIITEKNESIILYIRESSCSWINGAAMWKHLSIVFLLKRRKTAVAW